MEPSSLVEELAEFSRCATQMGDILASFEDCMDQIFGSLVAAVMKNSATDDNGNVNSGEAHINRSDTMMKPKRQEAAQNISVKWTQGSMDKINPERRSDEAPGYRASSKISLCKAVLTKSSKMLPRTIAARKRTADKVGQGKHRRRKKRWRPK